MGTEPIIKELALYRVEIVQAATLLETCVILQVMTILSFTDDSDS